LFSALHATIAEIATVTVRPASFVTNTSSHRKKVSGSTGSGRTRDRSLRQKSQYVVTQPW
jgi:hypothetical protein